MTSTRAYLVRDGDSQVTLASFELPALRARQVRFRTLASGICRSQLAQIADAASRPSGSARLLGHEAIARIESVGPQVTDVVPGDLVLIGWVPRSDALKEGAIEGVTFEVPGVGTVHTPDVFTWAERAICDAAFVYKIAGQVAPTDYAVIGCATVTGAGAIRTTLQADGNDTIGVVGVGGVGASAISAARALGSTLIIAIDVDDDKLGFARQLGATHVINSSREDVEARVAAITGGAGLDLVADCVGAPVTVQTGLQILRSGRPGVGRGGKLALVGVPQADVQLNLRVLQQRELTVMGSYGGSTVIERDLHGYLEWITEGHFPLSEHITHTVAFDRLLSGVERLARGEVLGRAIATFERT